MSEHARAELDQMYDFWLAHQDELLDMPGRFSSRKGGLPLAAEPEELVSAVLCKFAERITRSASDEELEERSAKARDLGYIYRALENMNTDYARRARREHPTSPDVIRDLREEASPDSDPEENRSQHDLERLRTIIGALRDRADGPSPRPTCLTAHHVASWRAVALGRGAQAALAEEWGVHPSRVTQIKASAHAKIRETVYVAGVLGPEGCLDDPASIRRCLDVYDSTADTHAHMTPADRVRLSTAANAVRITEDRGQRVDPRRAADLFLRRKDKKKLREQHAGHAGGGPGYEEFVSSFAEELHHAETLQARGAEVEHPNCVLVCGPHNPHRTDRVIWDAEICHD